MNEIARESAVEALQVEALLLSRTYLYTLFHKLLGGIPTADLLQMLTSETTLDVLDEYADDSASLARVIAFLKGMGAEDSQVLADEVSGEFTRLFVGPGRPEAFPIESPYRTGEATYFQENTVAVRSAYRAAGYEPKRAGHVPDDHVSLLCAFMARRSARSLEQLRTGDWPGLSTSLHEQAVFAEQHLSWLGEFARAARHGKTARLYPQLVEALEEFVAMDRVFMGEAALWARDAAARPDEGERPASFAQVEAALARLQALRLVGLDENELVER